MIYPNKFPIHNHNYAEKKVFGSLKKLDDYEFDVFWNRTFAGKSREEDNLYEIDFFIFDLRGERLNHVYVIEVKGGNMKFKAGENTWYQSGREMENGPDVQSMQYVSNIITRYKELLFNKVCISWALWFPDGELGGDLPTQLNDWRVLDQFDLDDPLNAIDAIRNAPDNQHYGFDGISIDEYESVIKEELLQDLGISENLRTLLDNMNISIEKAEANQKLLFTGFFEMSRLAVEGCAGSGKTILAKCGAELLNEKGDKVLFLCFNKFLAYQINGDLSKEIHADTLHNFMRQRVDELETGWFDRQEMTSDFFDRELPGKFRELLKVNQPGLEDQYDAILVDEAQDMEVGWLNLLLKYLKKDGKYFLFYDRRQNIFNKNFNLPISEDWTKFPLKHNYRNTRKINDFINEQTGTDFVSGLVPDGEEVKLRTYDPQKPGDSLLRCLSEVNKVAKIALDDILIITDGSTQDWDLENSGGSGLYSFTLLDPEIERDPNKAYNTSINRFKGCEAEVIILLLNQPLDKTEDKDLLYTQMSRAKSLLYMLEPVL